MDFVKLVIPGYPKGKERPRWSKKTQRMYTPAATTDYEDFIKLVYRQNYGTNIFPKGVPLDLRIRAYCPVPKSDTTKVRSKKLSGEIRPTVKPDLDNIGKIVADSLNKIAYYDDAQIVDSQTRKFYSDRPRVEILIQIAGGQQK